jgi:outer membrane protein
MNHRIVTKCRRALVGAALIALGLVVFRPAVAAEGQMKVGYVDVELVIRKSNYISGQVKSIEVQAHEYQDKIDQNLGRYDRLSAQFEEQKSVLSDSEAKTRRDSLAKIETETKDLQYKLQKLLSESQQKALAPTTSKITKIIKDIGEKDGYDLILTGESVLFAGKQMDLTKRVVDQLDKEAPAEEAATSDTAKTSSSTRKKDTGKKSPTKKSAPSGERKPSVE